MKHTMTKVAALVFALAPVAATGIVGAAAGAAVPSHVTEHMQLKNGKPNWPEITNSSWTVHKGQTVTVQIVSFDDGTAPLMGQYMKYTKVMGTNNHKELVNNKPVASVSDINVAHTFTIVGLGFNMPIPVAPTGGHITVTATFVANKVGTFVWHCFAPCGSGANGMGGAMSTMKWMEGKVKVVA